MKKSIWFFGLALVAVVVFIELDLASRLHSRNLPGSHGKFQQSMDIAAATSKPKGSGKDQQKPFEQKFTEVSNEISQLSENPEESENKIQFLAQQMNSKDIKKLSKIMADSNINGDQRALAVEVLSRNQTVDSLVQLEEFIQKHQTNSKWSRENEFESVLRAQAIEGIASYPQKDLAISALQNLDSKVEESFLKDRIKRSVAGLKSEAPTSDKQDEAALKQLVE